MRKHAANLITALRIALSLALLLTKPFSAPFFVLYALCGVSDAADGIVARKARTVSAFGARLDTAADMAFAAAVLVLLIPVLRAPLWILLWVGAVAALRIISQLAALARFRKFVPRHTAANKATGALLYVGVPFLGISGAFFAPLAALLCAAASLSALEELLIQLFSKSADPEIKWIFAKEQKNV
jgi:CDP-diacylglycerol--glycerol-3-phosphate 3-phosphatidyltransferase